MALEPRRRRRGDGDDGGGGGGGGGGRAGGEVQQQLALRPVHAQGLSAVGAAAPRLPPPPQGDQAPLGGRSLGRALGLGLHAPGETHRVRDDGAAALQRGPGVEGGGRGGGGVGVGGDAAEEGGEGAGGGEAASAGGLGSLDQVGGFGWTDRPVSPQEDATSSWGREEGDREGGGRRTEG